MHACAYVQTNTHAHARAHTHVTGGPHAPVRSDSTAATRPRDRLLFDSKPAPLSTSQAAAVGGKDFVRCGGGRGGEGRGGEGRGGRCGGLELRCQQAKFLKITF
jgi:hypothetical protein